MYALDNSHDGKDNLNFICELIRIDIFPPLIYVSAVAVATEETTADKGMDAGEGIDTSVLTGDIMARIKVSFSLKVLWLVFPVVKYLCPVKSCVLRLQTYMADDSFNGTCSPS